MDTALGAASRQYDAHSSGRSRKPTIGTVRSADSGSITLGAGRSCGKSEPRAKGCTVTGKQRRPGTFDSESAKQAARKSAETRRRKAAERKVQAAPTYALRKRWPEAPDIIEFTTHRDLLNLELSPAQEVLLRAIYGEPLTDEQLEIWRQCTGRQTYPEHGFSEATIIAGARSGKDSRIAAPIVVYESVFGNHEQALGRGEWCVVPLVAQDREATRVAFQYVADYFRGSRYLRALVGEELRFELRLKNRVTIRGFPSTLRSLRGWSIPCGVLDEIAFFRLEGAADADAEIQASIRRGMLHFNRTLLCKISTPYMRAGILYDDFRRHWGEDSPDVLVWRSSTLQMNPSIAEARLQRERRLDPVRYEREYEAEFAEDIECFLPAEWIEAAIVPDRHQLPPADGVKYTAAIDPSGGGSDHFAFSIVHRDGQRVVQDLIEGWRRRGGEQLDLEGVVREIVAACQRYRIHEVVGDRYAAGWVQQAFRRQGFRYAPAKPTKSECYADIQPLFAEARIDLLDHRVQAREFALLEKRPRAGGRALIDHPRGMHDDHCNVLALAAWQAILAPSRRMTIGEFSI